MVYLELWRPGFGGGDLREMATIQIFSSAFEEGSGSLLESGKNNSRRKFHPSLTSYSQLPNSMWLVDEIKPLGDNGARAIPPYKSGVLAQNEKLEEETAMLSSEMSPCMGDEGSPEGRALSIWIFNHNTHTREHRRRFAFARRPVRVARHTRLGTC